MAQTPELLISWASVAPVTRYNCHYCRQNRVQTLADRRSDGREPCRAPLSAGSGLAVGCVGTGVHGGARAQRGQGASGPAAGSSAPGAIPDLAPPRGFGARVRLCRRPRRRLGSFRARVPSDPVPVGRRHRSCRRRARAGRLDLRGSLRPPGARRRTPIASSDIFTAEAACRRGSAPCWRSARWIAFDRRAG